LLELKTQTPSVLFSYKGMVFYELSNQPGTNFC
jgi:hypothetical protein